MSYLFGSRHQLAEDIMVLVSRADRAIRIAVTVTKGLLRFDSCDFYRWMLIPNLSALLSILLLYVYL